MAPTAAFTEIFADVGQDIAAIGVILEDAILRRDAASVVVAYPGYTSVSYGVGPKKNTQAYAYLMPQKDRVNLGFYRGASLPDPEKLLEGTGKDLRHVKVRDPRSANSVAIGKLIDACIHERKNALGVS